MLLDTKALPFDMSRHGLFSSTVAEVRGKAGGCWMGGHSLLQGCILLLAFRNFKRLSGLSRLANSAVKPGFWQIPPWIWVRP